ncbi:MAG: response regulator [Bacteroidota bacterium]
MKPYQILIVEDIPLICQYYESVFNKLSSDKISFTIDTANTLDLAKSKIDGAKLSNSYEIVLLDLRLRDVQKKVTKDGEDLGVLIRRQLPGTKILVITSYDNHFRFHTVFQNISPEGFIIKQELNDEELKKAILNLFDDRNYYSGSVSKYLNGLASTKHKLDDIDRQLLNFLSDCLTTKEISKKLPLSQSGIEKRKRNLSKFFNLDDAKTVSLVKAAKENGFLS